MNHKLNNMKNGCQGLTSQRFSRRTVYGDYDHIGSPPCKKACQAWFKIFSYINLKEESQTGWD